MTQPVNEPICPPSTRRWLTPGVLAIGLASLLSDLGHETATAVLPLFLVTIGGSPLALGAIEGVADFTASAAKLAGGYFGQRLARRKPVAAGAYAVTALSTSAIALAQVWLHILVWRTMAWLGRGFRGPLRDTLLAEQTESTAYGRAFGFERAMDTVGAILGPILALALLAMKTEIRVILAVAAVPGLMAALLFLTVREGTHARDPQSLRQLSGG